MIRKTFLLVAVGLFALLLSGVGAISAETTQSNNDLTLTPIGNLSLDGAEIGAYDPINEYIFVTGAGVQIVDISDPTSPVLVTTIDPTTEGFNSDAVTSVAVKNGLLAIALPDDNAQAAGDVLFYDTDGNFLDSAETGALPDMVTFTHDGTKALTANEGEPDGIDPVGSITIVSIDANGSVTDVATAGFTSFDGQEDALRAAGVRLFAGKSVSEDVEPEYIAISADDSTAFVTLQEANSVAVLDIANATITDILPLGLKDHSIDGNGLDASDRDDAINIQTWPVFGMYMPDAIASYAANGENYFITANEGDDRGEDERIEDVTLDPTIFPNAATLQMEENIGRLGISSVDGDTDDDGDYDVLHVYGARSFTIWDDEGNVVFDSGDDIGQKTAELTPDYFNANDGDPDEFDTRSDNKGAEPEGVTTGVIAGRTYAFVGLERAAGGVMVYDITDPSAPEYITYAFPQAGQPNEADVSPEGLVFIAAADSPNGKPLLAITNEVSGSLTLYQISGYTVNLSLLHNNDGESALLTTTNQDVDGNGTNLTVGGVAGFATVTDREIADARANGNAVVNVYAGDAYLPSSVLACSQEPNAPLYDALAQTQIPYTAHIIGNHEFDFGPTFLERFIRAFDAEQPFLSSNLDFSGESGFDDLVDADGVIDGTIEDDRPLAHSYIYSDPVTGEQFGIVGATTFDLATISSPGNVTVTPDFDATVTAVQAEIDTLTAQNIDKIIFVSHLQSVNTDQALLAELRGVDLAVGGGGDEVLANSNASTPVADQLLPGEDAPVGEYPIEVSDADGETVYLVTMKGQYKYVGRLDVTFDSAGDVTAVIHDESYPRRVIPASAEATALGLGDAVTPDAAIINSVIDPVQDCLNDFATTIIADLEVTLDLARPAVRGRVSNAGNLIADAFMWTVASDNADRADHLVAVQNGGGIRQTAGDQLSDQLTRQNTLDILPFANFLTLIRDVPATTLKSVLELSVADFDPLGNNVEGEFLQVGGMFVVYDITQPVDSRVVSVTLNDGTPIISDGTIVNGAPAVDLVTNSFTAAGGDGFDMLAALTGEQLPYTYEAALVKYLREDTTSFPRNGEDIPVVQASDVRYQQSAENRIIIRQDPTDVNLTALAGTVTTTTLWLPLTLLLVGACALLVVRRKFD